MKHKIPTATRKGKTILVNGESPQTFPSISAAKRRSRELQQKNGGCGSGWLRVIKGSSHV
jgi:hypothetical protein